jgi:hypothetical protein
VESEEAARVSRLSRTTPAGHRAHKQETCRGNDDALPMDDNRADRRLFPGLTICSPAFSDVSPRWLNGRRLLYHLSGFLLLGLLCVGAVAS